MLLMVAAGSASAGSEPNSGVLVLNGNQEAATIVSGQARVLSRLLHVASADSEAISVNGQGRIECAEIRIEGGYELNGGRAQITGAVWTYSATEEDPYEERMQSIDLDAMVAAYGDGDRGGDGTELSNGDYQLSPGYFPEGMAFTGGTIRMLPGVYLLDSGFHATGQTVITGEGVTIVVLRGDISVAGGVAVELDAPESGEFEGVTFMMPGSNVGQISLSGGSELSIQGTIYAPESHMSITGRATSSTSGPFVGEIVIIDTLELAGRGVIMIGAPGNMRFTVDPKRD